jgi:beta-glucosidase
MAAARVRGFQGKGLGFATALAATPKHLGAYGAAEGGRDYNTAEVTERTLWEVYFPPFQAALNAGARVMMAGFNDLGGIPSHANRWLLTEVLRARWGFDGVVVSDWAGVEELMAHGIAPSRAEAARRALDAGVDLEMSTTLYRSELPALVRSGAVPIEAIDRAVLRVLRLKQALGLFATPSRRGAMTALNRTAVRQSARKAIVLLKNEAATGGTPPLPLRKDLGTIAVIGPLADDSASALGTWIGAGRAADAVTLLDGIRRAAASGTRVLHARGAPVDTVATDGFAEAARLARVADAVILALGERADMSGEAHSRAMLELPGSQRELAAAVLRAAREGGRAKPVVAVLMNGRPLALQWLADNVPAILETWFLGVEHGTAVADVLFGDYSPGGHLPVTFPRVTGQVPLVYYHHPTGRPPSERSSYSSPYVDVHWTPLFPFGHGLSYTTFTHGPPRLSAARIRASDTVVVEVGVANDGDREGDTVVQLYLRDDAASVSRPVRMLRGFARVTLRPGERRTVRFVLRPEHLALHDLRMRKVVEPGTFTVIAGLSSTEGTQARFEVVGDTLVLSDPLSRP